VVAAEVEFEDVDADVEGVLEGGEGVFGADGAGAAVAVDGNTGCGGGDRH